MFSLIDVFKNRLERTIITVAAKIGEGQTFRNRKLSLVDVMHLLIGAEGGSLARELHRAGIKVTPSAISQRRAQIPVGAFQNVFDQFNKDSTDPELFRGYRVLAVDGTAVNIARNPNAPTYVCHDGTSPRGYNQYHLNTLLDICNKTFYDVLIQPAPKADEMGALVEMVKRNDFKEKTLIIADRGYESYNVIAHLLEKKNVDFLIRIKQDRSSMRDVAQLPMFELDCDIRPTITTTQTNEDKQRKYIHLNVPKKSKPGTKTRYKRWDFPSPYKMEFRIVRFQLETGEFETVATSLPRSFSADDIRELYRQRWGIETSYRDLKYTLGLILLHGKSDDFAAQEIYAALTMFNFTSRVAREVVIHQPKEGVYAYKVNFKMAAMLCREFFRTPGADSGELMEEIARNTIPIRPGRADERNLKIKGFAGFTYRVAA